MDSSQLLASSIASGVLVGCSCTPFDVVKNYWQSNPSISQRRTSMSTSQVLHHIYSTRGLSVFWTGLLPALGVIVPANIIFFSLYEHFKKDSHDSPALAGMKARGAAVTVVAPVEFVRTKLQANIGEFTAWELTKYTFYNERLGSFWRGLIPTLLRDVPFSAVYWQLNEAAKKAMRRLDTSYEERSKVICSFLYPFITGGTSAGVACIVTHPCDIIKTNLQASERLRVVRGTHRLSPPLRAIEVFQSVWQKEGLRGFSVGLIPRLAKIVPSCAVLLSTYEFSSHLATGYRYYVDD